MANSREARVKLTNTELDKKNSEDEELPHELFLTTRQTKKLRNVFC